MRNYRKQTPSVNKSAKTRKKKRRKMERTWIESYGNRIGRTLQTYSVVCINSTESNRAPLVTWSASFVCAGPFQPRATLESQKWKINAWHGPREWRTATRVKTGSLGRAWKREASYRTCIRGLQSLRLSKCVREGEKP